MKKNIKHYIAEKSFFVSDLHLGHKNLLTKHFTRRHEVYGYDVNVMNEALIANWNSVVPEDGHVFNLGDIGFLTYNQLAPYVARLNGTIHMVRGNHDDCLNFPNVESVDDYLEIQIGAQHICMSHYPHYTWNGCHRGSWMLCGHEHSNINSDEHMKLWKIMDVGIDCNPKYRPFSFNEIKAVMDTRSNRGHH